MVKHGLHKPPLADVPGCLGRCTGTREVHLSHSTLACCFLPPFHLHFLCQVDHKSALQASINPTERETDTGP